MTTSGRAMAEVLLLAMLAGCGGRSGLMAGKDAGADSPRPDSGAADGGSREARPPDGPTPDLTPPDLQVPGPDLGPAKKTWTATGGGNGPNLVKALAVDGQRTVFVTGAYSGSATFGKYKLTSAGAYDIFLARLGPDGKFIWVLGGGGPGFDSGSDVAVGPGGDVWLAGEFNGDITLGAKKLTSVGSSDVFVARISPAGTVKWVATGGGSGLDRGTSVAVDASTGHAYLAGSITAAATLGQHKLQVSGLENSILACLTPTGTFSWAQSAASSTWSRPVEVQFAANGAIYVAGNFGDSVTLGSKTLKGTGTGHGFLARFNSAGKAVWAEAAVGPKEVQMAALATDSSGSVYATGLFDGKMTLGALKVPLSSTSGTLLFKRIFVVKISPGGAGEWVLSDDGSTTSIGQGVVVRVSPASSPYLLGTCNTAYKLGSLGVCQQGPFLARLTTAGKATWATGLLPKGGTLMELDAAGGVYLARDEYYGQILIYKLTP